MAKRRGHYCYVCDRIRANEKFSGKGHAKHICKDCAKKQRAKVKEETIKQDTLEKVLDLFDDEVIILDALDDNDYVSDESSFDDWIFNFSDDDLPF